MSLIPASIAFVVSKETVYFILSGNSPANKLISSFIVCANSVALDPGAWYKAIIAEVFPFNLAFIL